MSAARSVARWYKRVEIAKDALGHAVLLDGKKIVTPARATLHLPNEHLALAVAHEWDGQRDDVRPHTMPLTKLATTSTDQVGQIRGTMVDSMLRTLDADVLCVRVAKSEDAELHQKEKRAYDPILAWARAELSLPLAATETLILEHPPEAAPRAAQLLAAADDWELAAIDQLSGTCKSLVLALAVYMRHIDSAAACRAARLAEQHQIDEWGEVEAGHDLDEADLAVRVTSASAFLRLYGWEKKPALADWLKRSASDV